MKGILIFNIKNIFSKKYIDIVFSIITGLLGTLSFSPYQFWFTSIISIFGLLKNTINRNPMQSAFLGFLWGIGLFGTGISWIFIGIKKFGNISTFFSITLIISLVIYLSLYPTIFTYFLTYFWKNNYKYRFIFGAPGLWIIIEYIRGFLFTGFPWLEFGYSQTDTILNKIAPIFGVKGITFLIIMISGTIIYSIFKRCIICTIFSFSLFLFPFLINGITWYKINESKKIKVALIQGNIIPNEKNIYKKEQEPIDIYLHYSIPLIGKVKIIIWPESAFIKTTEKDILLKYLNKKLYESKTVLISGIINIKNKYNYYNSIIILGKSLCYRENENEQYNKHHLVPFGESIPKNKFFKLIIQLFGFPLLSSFNNGPYMQKQLKVLGMKIIPSICYEAIFGEQIKDNFSTDTDFLLTISNNVWFENSIESYQFFQMIRMRSLELGRMLLYCSNSGMTSIIYPNGKIKNQLPQFTRGTLISCITSTTGKTPYSIYGSYPVYIISIFFISFGLIMEHYYSLKKIFKRFFKNKN